MKKTFKLLLFSILISVKLIGQEIFINDQYGFSFQKPTDWIEASNDEIFKNLDKLEMTEEDLTKFISDHKGSIMLVSYYKYNPRNHAGLIPTVQINVRVNATRNFEEFNQLMNQSAESFKDYFENFEFIEKPHVIDIDGRKSVYFVSKFTMPIQNGGVMKVKSYTYAIPYGSYFFQINFTDGQDKEDCTNLFSELLKSIKIGK